MHSAGCAGSLRVGVRWLPTLPSHQASTVRTSRHLTRRSSGVCVLFNATRGRSRLVASPRRTWTAEWIVVRGRGPVSEHSRPGRPAVACGVPRSEALRWARRLGQLATTSTVRQPWLLLPYPGRDKCVVLLVSTLPLCCPPRYPSSDAGGIPRKTDRCCDRQQNSVARTARCATMPI
jgi:hypothetical protein